MLHVIAEFPDRASAEHALRALRALRARGFAEEPRRQGAFTFAHPNPAPANLTLYEPPQAPVPPEYRDDAFPLDRADAEAPKE